jgi:hypothetical protein
LGARSEVEVSCVPVIERATATEFSLKNKSKAQNFIVGELTSDGQLSFIVENLPKDGTGCRGRWMFDAMMKHFGTSVTAIQGNWTYGDNLATANRLTAGGTVNLEDAAKQAATGKYAAAWGFFQVEILPQTAGLPGNYTCVYVLFKK